MECRECNGTGKGYFSCCTGESVNEDIQRCPECKENLAEEDCPYCNGTGRIEEKPSAWIAESYANEKGNWRGD